MREKCPWCEKENAMAVGTVRARCVFCNYCYYYVDMNKIINIIQSFNYAVETNHKHKVDGIFYSEEEFKKLIKLKRYL